MLPSERELAEIFDVSRVPIREALKVLEFVGVVQNVHGKGVFVKKITANDIIDNIDVVMMNSNHALLDLFEVREGIEIQAVYLAAERRTDEDLATIEAALDEMGRKDDAGAGFMESTMDFHSAVIAASHNMALVDINRYLIDWLRYLRNQFMKGSRTSEQAVSDHRELFDLIKAKDSAAASQKMREHLARAKHVLEQAVREQG